MLTSVAFSGSSLPFLVRGPVWSGLGVPHKVLAVQLVWSSATPPTTSSAQAEAPAGDLAFPQESQGERSGFLCVPLNVGK